MHQKVGGVMLLVAGMVAAGAAPAAGQRVPGYHGDYDNASAQFRAWALAEYMETFDDWMEALNERDVDGAVRYFADDATVELGASLKGREDIRKGLREWLADVTYLRAGLGDFEASGKLAHGSMRVVISHGEGQSPSTGTLLVLMRQDGSNFKIRSLSLLQH